MFIDLEPIQIVWLKRDLRLEDHPPLRQALLSKRRVLILYVFEDILIEDPHYSSRHFEFIKQSIHNLNTQLKPFNSKVITAKGSVVKSLKSISKKFKIEKKSNIFNMPPGQAKKKSTFSLCFSLPNRPTFSEPLPPEQKKNWFHYFTGPASRKKTTFS